PAQLPVQGGEEEIVFAKTLSVACRLRLLIESNPLLLQRVLGRLQGLLVASQLQQDNSQVVPGHPKLAAFLGVLRLSTHRLLLMGTPLPVGGDGAVQPP